MNYEIYGPYIPVIMLIAFLSLFAWVFHPENKEKYEEAAKIPLHNNDHEPAVNFDIKGWRKKK